MAGPKDEGVSAPHADPLQTSHLHRDSDSTAERDQVDKAFATARAKLALAGGYGLHVLDVDGRAAYLVTRWNLSRELKDLDSVNAFIRQVGGDA